MKNKRTILTIVFALVLALSIATVSAAAISANGTKPDKPDKPATKPDTPVCEASGDCAVQPLGGFVKGLEALTEEEKTSLLADLADIEKYEDEINGIYARMTDENADELYDELDALYEKLDSVLERNAELWDRVDAEYDERIAADEPDITFELCYDDLAVCGKAG